MPSLEELPVSFPKFTISADVDASAVAKLFQTKLNDLGPEDFQPDAVWRDIYAMTGTLRTFYGVNSICKVWHEISNALGVEAFELEVTSATVFRAGPVAWVQAIFNFETAGPPATTCQAIVSLVPDEKREWRLWMLRTILEQVKGEGNVDVMDAAKQGISIPRPSSQTHFDCVVVGGGQAGLAQGGRLQALGVDYVVLDEHPEVGDSWNTRYDSCKLHLPRDYAHMLFERTYSSQQPHFLTKNDVADGHRRWAKKYHINIWTNSKLQKGQWDTEKKRWILSIGPDGTASRTITASQVVIAVGAGGRFPRMPEYLDKDKFEGIVLHSSDYKNSVEWKGKHGVVVGTANTAHDVAEDMVYAGLKQTTMMQRSPTCVVQSEHIGEVIGEMYNNTIPTALADKLDKTLPLGVTSLLMNGFFGHKAKTEPEGFDAMEKAGFKIDRDASAAQHILVNYGGHCVDVGSGKMIAKGLIKIKNDSLPQRYLPDGLEFEDGSKLKADVIVFATGFSTNMKEAVRDLFGDETAEAMGDCKGLMNEGEVKGTFKPGGHPAMWYLGGDISTSRYFSRFIAMSIKARLAGKPLPIYNKYT